MAELDQSTCVEQDPPTGQLGRLFEGLCKSSSGQAPSIQAYFLDQSFPRDFFLADILANDSALSECAPGPFLFDNDNEIDAEGKRWKLPSMPNYFVLQLSEGTKDENFYIANQNGFPINCQSFKLRQQENSTLVLVPKTKLEAGKGYYLYLILNQGAMRRTWIQPISLATAND